MLSLSTTEEKEKKPFECHICNANLTRKFTLRTHIALVHEGKRPMAAAFVINNLLQNNT